MNRLAVGALVAPLLLQAVPATAAVPAAAASSQKASACVPSPTPLHASAAPVAGLSTQQVQNAVAIINEGAALKVPQRGQTLAVMTALETSSLTSATSTGLFGQDAAPVSTTTTTPSGSPTPTSVAASAQGFYRALTQVKNWQNLPPTLAAHAAQRNLDPNVYARYYTRAVTVVNALTTGTGAGGLQNLAARATAIANCEAATVKGRFAVDAGTAYVGPFTPTVLVGRALDFAKNGGNGWFDRCQAFVANLDGRAYSGYSTALDAWQTFEAQGVAHPVTSPDGVSPPVGAWLYYSSGNPAGHVAVYLGNGQLASTDVFGQGRVGVGPASALTNGPWHLQYLGWAPPWGAA